MTAVVAAAETAMERFDRHMVEATGYVLEDYSLIRDSPLTCLERMQLFGTLVDESGAVQALEKYDQEDRKSNAGRKPLFTFRAVLILYMMHIDDKNNRYDHIARTLYAQMTPETRAYLELPKKWGSKRDWYCRYWRAMNRVLELCEPWKVDKKHHLTAKQYKRALKSYSQSKRDRMDELMNMLVHATVRRLPADIRATYSGNIAIDGTLIEVAGRPNPGKNYDHEDRRNLDAMSGRYRRGGKHDGKGKVTDKAGWEMQTVVTVPNSPKQPNSFPILTTGLAFHQPGRIKHGPRIAMEAHAREFTERGYMMADRAYNGLTTLGFQLPTRQMGFRGVYNYKKKESDVQGAIDDVIFIGGRPYVKWMPPAQKTARKDFLDGKINRETYESLIEKRKAYELKDKGKPAADGSQRFTYPDLSGAMCIDPATKNPIKPKLKKATFTLHPNTEEAMRVIKHLSGFAFKSQEWQDWHGLRSHVESNNQYVKADAETDLGNPEKRRARGYAYHALTSAMAFAVSNMRRIVSFIEAQAVAALGEKDLRQRMRNRAE